MLVLFWIGLAVATAVVTWFGILRPLARVLELSDQLHRREPAPPELHYQLDPDCETSDLIRLLMAIHGESGPAPEAEPVPSSVAGGRSAN